MSNIFKQVLTELGIKHYTSSAYHPESQGALERFHQTLKKGCVHTAQKIRKIGMKAYTYCYSHQESRFKMLNLGDQWIPSSDI